MKILNLLALFLLFSCQKSKPEVAVDLNAKSKEETEISKTKENFLKTDTISISDGEDSSSKKNYILAHLVSQNADKDSLVTANFQLDYYQNQTKTSSAHVAIKGFDKGSYWSGKYGLSSEPIKTSPFIQLSCGVEACGYAQNHFLFYSKDKLDLVYQWDTFSDSGYGSWMEFSNQNKDSETKSFYCKTVAFEPTADENEDVGILKYSDSTLFELKNNHWTTQLLSVKDKAYFEKQLSFEELGKRK